jgi:beta-fructofuranosidase
MYTARGGNLSELGDVEVFPTQDQIHLFHLTLPNHDVVHHAVSDDGLSWRELPRALHTGDPDECDDDQIWTMSVTESGGAYYMLYTALARAESGRVQRTALATSTDLIHWTKHPGNPVGQADPRWYESAPETSGRVSWRDPKPILVGDTYYAAVCAREASGPLMRRGCIGQLASKDLVTWEARPPLLSPHRYWDLECPQVFELGGVYYATAGAMEDWSQRYWMAPRYEGPYVVPPDGGVLAPKGHYAGRVCRWQGLDLYFCWHTNKSWTETDYDWLTPRSPLGKFVVAPLVLVQRPDGSLGRRSFPAWASYRDGAPRVLAPASETLLRSASAGAVWSLQAGGGMDVLASAEHAEDIWLVGELTLAGVRGGIAFRLDDQGGGYYVEIVSGSTEVILKKWLPINTTDGRPSYRYVELQRGALQQSVAPGEAIPFLLISSGAYVECSLGGEVVLSTLSAERTVGRVGIWAESGDVSASELAWAPLRKLRHT